MNATETFWQQKIELLGFWVKWNAVLSWVMAGFMALTLVGLLVAWLPAWAAIELRRAHLRLKQAASEVSGTNGAVATQAMSQAFQHLGRQFVLTLSFTLSLLLLILIVVGWALHQTMAMA